MRRTRLAVDMARLEVAFERGSWEVSDYLDLDTGEVLSVTAEVRRQLEDMYAEAGEDDLAAHVDGLDEPQWIKDAIVEADRVERGFGVRIVEIPRAEASDDYGDMEDFIATVADQDLRGRLYRAIAGRGAFRWFRDALASHRGEQQRWIRFQQEAVRSRIVDWLRSLGVEPVFEAIPEPVPGPPARVRLLGEALEFVRAVRELPGIRRIALLGSLASDKQWPKDVDLILTVDDDADLEPVAKLARRLQGHAQSLGLGADVFLAGPAGDYLGRTCPWSRCGPGIRASCDALHCGRRMYLHDDLEAVRLPDEVTSTPPVNLWPAVRIRTAVPNDVRETLLTPFEAATARPATKD
ncbi:MAG TPA: UPF0158 family protein [Actinomycetota bacterium]|nr:UPF0158 family protein [Actinomycetota bacterium]